MWAIGIWPNVIEAAEWPEIEALLLPAAKLNGGKIETGEGWAVWTVHKDGELVGAATVRLTVEDAAEVTLVGGHGFQEWIEPLDDLIGCWAIDEGCTELRAFGRRGWVPTLTRQGWESRLDGKRAEFRRGLT